MDRRKFRREGEEKRRDQLINAALEIIAESGPEGATVRAIAARAGVTQGLIRHYFSGKDELTRAAYQALMARMTADNELVLHSIDSDPRTRLAAFVAAALRPPVMDETSLAMWAGFLNMVRKSPEMAAIHEAYYLDYRRRMEALIAALPGRRMPADLRRLGIACTAVIDGLWLEGSVYGRGFGDDELAGVGVRSVGDLLGIDLTPFLEPPSPRQDDRANAPGMLMTKESAE